MNFVGTKLNNSANNYRTIGRGNEKGMNDRRNGRKERTKGERENSADHSLWLCSWLSWSSSFVHASTLYPSMVFLPRGFVPLFIEPYYFIATRRWMHFAHAVVQRKVFRPFRAHLCRSIWPRCSSGSFDEIVLRILLSFFLSFFPPIFTLTDWRTIYRRPFGQVQLIRFRWYSSQLAFRARRASL